MDDAPPDPPIGDVAVTAHNGPIRKYPPVKFGSVDDSTGEVRIFELNFSKLTTPDAFMGERNIEWALQVLFQWKALLHALTARDAEDTAKTIKYGERR